MSRSHLAPPERRSFDREDTVATTTFCTCITAILRNAGLRTAFKACSLDDRTRGETQKIVEALVPNARGFADCLTEAPLQLASAR